MNQPILKGEVQCQPHRIVHVTAQNLRPRSPLLLCRSKLMARIDKLYLEHPWMGSCSFADHLTTPELLVRRGRIRRLMRVMGIESLAPKLGTSRRQPKHPVYTCLLYT